MPRLIMDDGKPKIRLKEDVVLAATLSSTNSHSFIDSVKTKKSVETLISALANTVQQHGVL